MTTLSSVNTPSNALSVPSGATIESSNASTHSNQSTDESRINSESLSTHNTLNSATASSSSNLNTFEPLGTSRLCNLLSSHDKDSAASKIEAGLDALANILLETPKQQNTCKAIKLVLSLADTLSEAAALTQFSNPSAQRPNTLFSGSCY